MNPKKPRIETAKEYVEQTSFAELKSHCLTAALLLKQATELAADLRELANLAYKQKKWPAHIGQTFAGIARGVADDIDRQAALINKFAEDVINTPVPK